MTEPVRLCKACRWAVNTVPGAKEPHWSDWICGHAGGLGRPPMPDYVFGQPRPQRQDKCQYVRDDEDRCGPEGRFWEPRDEPELGFGPKP